MLEAVNAYLSANLLLCVALLLLRLALRTATWEQPVRYRDLRRFGYLVVAAAVCLPWVAQLFDSEGYVTHSVQIWSAPSTSETSAMQDSHRLAAATVPTLSIPLQDSSRLALTALLAGLAFLSFRLLRDGWQTWNILRTGCLIRSYRNIRILVAEEVKTPFSVWVPGRYFIVLPFSTVLQASDLRVALRHEAQHHRQGDTKLVYVCQLLRGLFFWNPAAHALARRLLELQEFSCDEALTRRRIAVDIYCSCLVRSAEASLADRAMVRVGMAACTSALLKRRIEALLRQPRTFVRPGWVWVAACVSLSSLTWVSLAATTPIQDRRIQQEVAASMVADAQRTSAFPFVANEEVLRQLNLMLGTPDGRRQLRHSIKRMAEFGGAIKAELNHRRLPMELLAIPLVESGFRNLPSRREVGVGAGVWMFIAPTARRYGLRVDSEVDERLDVALSTKAALNMLSDLHAKYGDWPLAILAYNTGDRKIERGRRAGRSDAWSLVEGGFENDPDYLARVMAVALVVGNPKLLD